MGDKSILVEYVPGKSSSHIVTANGNSLDVQGTGQLPVDNNKVVPNISYVLGVTKNLLSIGHITNTHKIIVFDSQYCHVYDHYHRSRPLLMGTRDLCNLLYRLHMKPFTSLNTRQPT